MPKLIWHNYRYYPYERELARRESAALLSGVKVCEAIDGLDVVGPFDHNIIKRLTYFSGLKNGESFTPTVQDRLEAGSRIGRNRQSTRYSAHGLHEYKGKFNPQVAKSLLNIFLVHPGHHVLDPFCGSGTTLVECAHMGVRGFGTDLNPLAIYITNAKLLALTTPVTQLRSALKRIAGVFHDTIICPTYMADNERTRYLSDWFELPILHTLEALRVSIEAEANPVAPVFFAIASNLLRDYSKQDPYDLRIRRRKSPLPTMPFWDAFRNSTEQALARLDVTQSELDADISVPGRAVVADVTALKPLKVPGPFDAAITSPPYAMALPYIDTQRLSLVWLELLDANHIRDLEASLVGSREIRGSSRRKAVEDHQANVAKLPEQESEFCATLQDSLGPKDGFRRKAVPTLLYRYFAGMKRSFSAVHKVMKPGAPFGVIVGNNHTVLSGVRFDIDTPTHLVSLADHVGWCVEEILPLQTYQRYGYHMNNAVSAESLIILRA